MSPRRSTTSLFLHVLTISIFFYLWGEVHIQAAFFFESHGIEMLDVWVLLGKLKQYIALAFFIIMTCLLIWKRILKK